jgi:uncharacterized protein DUF5715
VNLSAPDINAYRAAVDDLMIEVAAHTGPDGRRKARTILTDRLADAEFTDLLNATPRGAAAALQNLLGEVETYQPNSRSSAADLAALIRIHLLSHIDAHWWGRAAPFANDVDVLGADDLVDVDDLAVGFRYRRQVTTFAGRVARAAERRIMPQRTPRTAGLRFTRTRPEAVALIQQLAGEFRAGAPAGTPPLWVTSLTRSVQHQHRLRALGYAAVLPSSHCTGYGIDIEMTWYRRCGAHVALQRLLLARQDTGDINVIGEGQAWHVCISPAAIDALRADFTARIGS